MEIIVSDTNIFIDLQSVGLLEAMFQLPCKVHTVDFVMAEILDSEQSASIKILVEEGKIYVHSFSREDVLAIAMEHSTVSGNLSFPDVSVCYYARAGKYKLITGDRQLRNYAQRQQVEVHGLLYIFDEMVEYRILPKTLAISKLKEIMRINVRLPKSEIELRIANWSN